jgi:hypothetical protein
MGRKRKVAILRTDDPDTANGRGVPIPRLDLGTDSESHRRFDGVVPTRSQWYRSQYVAGQAVTPYAAR